MVREGRRLVAAEQARDADLTAGRRQQVASAHDQIDALPEVIDARDELIRPVAEPIANDDVAALRRGILRAAARSSRSSNVSAPGSIRSRQATPSSEREAAIATRAADSRRFVRGGPSARGAAISLPAARAAVEQAARGKIGCAPPRRSWCRSLCRDSQRPARNALGGKDVRREAEPVEVVENRALVFGPAALAVVILDAQQHARAVPAREAPDVVRVQRRGRGAGSRSARARSG